MLVVRCAHETDARSRIQIEAPVWLGQFIGLLRSQSGVKLFKMCGFNKTPRYKESVNELKLAQIWLPWTTDVRTMQPAEGHLMNHVMPCLRSELHSKTHSYIGS